MTKKKVNQQNSSVKFKFKLTKKDKPVFNLKMIEDALSELYYNKPRDRSIKLVTNSAGLDMINKAMKAEFQKYIDNEYR